MITAKEKNTLLNEKTLIGENFFERNFCTGESIVTNRKYIGLSFFSCEPAVDFTIDQNGNRTTMTDPTGATNYRYDQLNRLTSITNPSGQTTTFTYDAIGRRTDMTYANGVTASYGYDNAGRLLSLVNQIGATTVSTFSYNYDKVGNRTQMTDNDGQHNYLYDQLYRLIDATHPQPQNPAENFSYDPVGNRTASQISSGYTYDNMNRLLSDDQYTYVYDANGSLTSKTDKATSSVMTYQYDAENRLTQVTSAASQINYQYDGMARLIARTVNGVTTKYVYDEKDVLLELDDTNQIKARYTRTLDIDELISVERDTTNDGTLDTTYYYHRDGLGSVTAMTDSGGVVAASYVYDSFGSIKSQTGSVENRYTYTSREWDQDAGLYYYRARFYNAGIGRFISEDPKSFDAGINFYIYVQNNPINFVDPLGLYTWPYSWQGWAGVTLTGSGTVMLFTPGLQTPGIVLITAGTAFNIWDLIEGLRQAERDTRKKLKPAQDELDKLKKLLDGDKKQCPTE